MEVDVDKSLDRQEFPHISLHNFPVAAGACMEWITKIYVISLQYDLSLHSFRLKAFSDACNSVGTEQLPNTLCSLSGHNMLVCMSHAVLYNAVFGASCFFSQSTMHIPDNTTVEWIS